MIKRSAQTAPFAGVLIGLAIVASACGSPALPDASGGAPIQVTTTLPEPEPVATEVDTEAGTVDDTVAVDEEPPVTVEPLDNSISAGDEWSDVTANLAGLSSDCGNLSFVAGHPQTDQVLAGVALQGMWELNEAGDEWSRLGTEGFSAPIGNRTTSILFDPDDPARYWQSGSYAAGAFRTDNGGGTFAQLGNIDHLDYVSVDLTDPFRRTMLAGGHERTEIYRSVDGGQNWTSLAPNLPSGAGFASYPLVIDATTHLLGTNSDVGSGIFRSTDEGQTWELVIDVPVSSAPILDGDNIYWLVANGGGIVMSADGGESFEFTGTGTGGAPLSLVQLPGGLLATHNESSILVTSDAGGTWIPVGPPLPYIPWGVAYSEQRDSFYIWQFTCDFTDDDHAVIPMSIMQLDVSVEG